MLLKIIIYIILSFLFYFVLNEFVFEKFPIQYLDYLNKEKQELKNCSLFTNHNDCSNNDCHWNQTEGSFCILPISSSEFTNQKKEYCEKLESEKDCRDNNCVWIGSKQSNCVNKN